MLREKGVILCSIKIQHYFLKCLLATWDFSVENSLLRRIPHFLTGLFRISISNFLSSLDI